MVQFKSQQLTSKNKVGLFFLFCILFYASLNISFASSNSQVDMSSAKLKKVALVIGNSEYKVKPLSNPINDATRMAQTLERFGFTVILGLDLTKQEMQAKLVDFENKLSGADVALFFFAGHGVQEKDVNFLIPISSKINSTKDLDNKALSAGVVLQTMERSDAVTNIIILDACRDNPLPPEALSRSFSGSSRGISIGLAKMDAPSGSIIVYATAPGTVAADGLGDNGLFTGHLLNNMSVPGASIYDIAMATRRSVIEESGGTQIPWELSSLVQPFYFQPVGNQSQIMFANNNQSSFLQNGKVPLTIYTKPEPAKVEFVKSARTFEQGMLLDPAKYKVKITAEGFEPMVRTIDLKRSNAHEFVLNPALKDELFVTENISFNMKAIPGAEFDFGCGTTRKCPEYSLAERKKMYLNGFRLMDTEVTWGLYKLCMEEGNCEVEDVDQSLPSDSLPVGAVSYFDVVENFIPWLEDKTGQRFRLPSEAEWEYAAKTRGKLSCEYEHIANCSRDKIGAIPAGSLKPNAFGLYDMVGNLEEMVADCFTKDIDLIPSDGSANMMTSCREHVVKGNSYFNEKFEVNMNTRTAWEKADNKRMLGFRLAQSAQDINISEQVKQR